MWATLVTERRPSSGASGLGPATGSLIASSPWTSTRSRYQNRSTRQLRHLCPRCRQERLLFSFFSEGLSCLECSYYGFYFVGAMVDEGSFNPMADRRAITPSFVTKRYEARFRNEPLTQSMLDVDQCAEAKEWREIRNVLSHRAAPGRGFYQGGPRSGSADWMDGVLSGDAIRERRAWVGGAVTSLLVPAVDFVRRQLP